MEFDFVDEGCVARNSGCASGAKGQLIGEIEAVYTTGIHELEGMDEAGEHGLADNMQDRRTLPIGLIVRLARQHEIGLVIELDTLSVDGIGAGTLLENLIIETFGVTLDGGIVLDKLLEIGFLSLFHLFPGVGSHHT